MRCDGIAHSQVSENKTLCLKCATFDRLKQKEFVVHKQNNMTHWTFIIYDANQNFTITVFFCGFGESNISFFLITKLSLSHLHQSFVFQTKTAYNHKILLLKTNYSYWLLFI